MPESRSNGKGKDDEPLGDSRLTLSTHESGDSDGGPAPDGDVEGVLKQGAKVGRYLVVEFLGAGAMGVVYAAYDPKLDRKIALKLLRPQEGRGDQDRRTARLEREAQGLAKLSHTNVVGIFDVGVHEGQVFLAMEHLSGGTLADWLAAEKRTWREIVRMFIEVGNGLAAAHAEGLTHRDFKPDNVLLDKAGKPKVVDFGLVRLARGGDLTGSSTTLDPESTDEDIGAQMSLAATMPAALTRTGALAGTPAYMAPEQFLGKPVDARTDQFAFCVALYEALYGERPFPGDTVFQLADAVTDGRVRPSPKNTEVPNWVRTCVLRGLRVGPAERYPGFERLLATLGNDPAIRLKRRASVVAIAAAVGLSLFLIQRRTERRHREFEQRVATFVSAGDKQLSAGLEKTKLSDHLRQQSLSAFDGARQADGERLWVEYKQVSARMDEAFRRAQAEFGAALEIDKERPDVRQRLFRALSERARLAEIEARTDDLDALRKQLEALSEKAPAWKTPATITFSAPSAAQSLGLERFLADPLGRLIPAGVAMELSKPQQVEPGSYRLRIRTHDGLEVFVPFVAVGGTTVQMTVALPARGSIPNGFAFVPAGDFFFGDANDDWRTSFLNAVPIHKRKGRAFLIGKTELPVSAWLKFLNDLPAAERRRRTPDASNHHGSVRLEQIGAELRWQYVLGLKGKTWRFGENEPVQYPGRSGTARRQLWTNLPVTGISADDAMAFVRWFSKSLPNARLCTEEEWERAARGADARTYPASERRLLPADANIDATYGRVPTAFGPDEVNAHAASTSPFGLVDMAGNVWEMTTSILAPGEFVLRGGSYYHGAIAAALTNREPVDAGTRSPVMGFRVCADVPEET